MKDKDVKMVVEKDLVIAGLEEHVEALKSSENAHVKRKIQLQMLS